MVMMTAITPSLNATSRSFSTALLLPLHDRSSRCGGNVLLAHLGADGRHEKVADVRFWYKIAHSTRLRPEGSESMAAAARTAPSSGRRFVSPAIRALAQRRAAELTGLALGLAGLVLLVALASYDPRDPSFDTASSIRAQNLVGPVGRVRPICCCRASDWPGHCPASPRSASLGGSPRGAASAGAWRGCLALLAGIPAMAAALASLPFVSALPWPASPGPGGAAGLLLARAALGAGRGLLGPVGAALVGRHRLGAGADLGAARLRAHRGRVAGGGAGDPGGDAVSRSRAAGWRRC